MGKLKGKPLLSKQNGQMKISSFFSATTAPTKDSNHLRVCDSLRTKVICHGKDGSSSTKFTTKDISYKTENSSALYSKSTVTCSENEDCKIMEQKSSIVSDKIESPIKDDRNCLDSSVDSDLDIIECTPEVKKCNISIISCRNITRSPDIIPATPDAYNKCNLTNSSLCSKSDLSVKHKIDSTALRSHKSSNISKLSVIKPGSLSMKKKVNISLLSKKISEKSKISYAFDESKMKLSRNSLSVKRPAITGAGVSPDSKRVNGSECVVGDEEISSCKLNLRGKFNSCSPVNDRDSIMLQLGEIDGSISMLKPDTNSQEKIKDINIKFCKQLPKKHLQVSDKDILRDQKGEPCTGTGKPSLEIKEEAFSMLSQIQENTEDAFRSNEENMNQENVTRSLERNSIPFGDESSQGFTVDKSVEDNLVLDEVSSKTKISDIFEDTFHDMFDDDLAEDFEKMSPFKQQIKENKALEIQNKQVKKLLNEGLGKDSYVSQGNFGRHIVTAVERDSYKGELLLQLTSVQDKSVKTCTLSGFWSQSVVLEGDIVHILFANPVDGHFTVDNSKGLIVINPDFLISGTSVVSAVFCRRKAVLNERFKGMDSSNQLMLIGSLVHQLFQEVVKNKIKTHAELDKVMRELMSQPKILRDLYGIGVPEATIYEEMINFIPRIHAWSQVYLDSNHTSLDKVQEKEQRRNQWNGKIVEIQDIEENIWSPKYGVKGKIDLTVKTSQCGVSKVIPLELKTGRSSFSAEHRGQVTLYSMMSGDRRQDPKAGLLLYLKDGAMEEVPAGDNEKRGLIQLRNDIIHYITAKPVLLEGNLPQMLPPLPEPIDFERACTKCAHLVTCSIYQKIDRNPVPEPPHAMATLVPNTTDHLLKTHLDYFRHWCLLLHLEISDGKKHSNVRGLWCQDPIKREFSGDCLSWLVLVKTIPVIETVPGQFLHAFTRSSTHPNPTKLASVGLQVADNIVVSSETEIALSLGVIASFEEDSVRVVMDRDLTLYSNWNKKKFHVDRCEYQNTMSINFTNLAKLLMDTPQAARLRALVIDRNRPSFKKGLSPEVVSKGKHILKSLNKIQQRAVLRTLMAESYSLLKGYPGTGKTSIIVAMVQLMVTLGLSVLLTSYTHSAVDNILLKLKVCNVDFLRLGRLSRIHPDLQSYADEIVTCKFKNVSSFSEFYANKLVVATTCLGINHVLFSKRTFDFCIIDEASQVLQAAALGPLFHASRFILVGDPQQLPPVVQSKEARNLGMSESLFMLLDSQGATSNLTVQYRMNGPIMRIANCLMYDNQLQCASPDLETATVHLPNYRGVVSSGRLECWQEKVLEPSLEHSVMFLDTCGAASESQNGSNVVNNKEAAVVVALIQALTNAGLTTEGVGVITPYRAQVKQIRDCVIKEVTMGERVEVNTVDQYQGRDKDVILYSCVRSGAAQLDVSEILQDDRRLNVAVTRAKYKLIMVGDIASLQVYAPFKKLTAILEPHQIYQLKDGEDGFVWQDPVSL
ncbi:DNA replication ATP-dependent helicase/nuclease DNA2 [Procambarus clarkii]|uniref:DNA replication ATP-dependent helicase/nuclease DNA2 n=1 Tax=Procambarus clarkii TaxID=6728 RepID=UPI003742BE16